MSTYESAKTSRSWFAVFNNPSKHGYGVDIVELDQRAREVCDRLKAEWCVTGSRIGAWAYCVKRYNGCYPVYADDDLEKKVPVGYNKAITEEEKTLIPEDFEHVHMVLEDDKPMAWGTVKNTYAIGMHFEPTKGTKREAEDYISKTGDYAEDSNKKNGLPWEEIIYVARQGDIRGKQGQKSDLENIGRLLKEGLKPNEILARDVKFYRHEAIIKKAFFDMREKEIPFKRDVYVCWHMGPSGSGKSYAREKFEKCYGLDEIFYMTNFNPNTRFDGYCGQKILWIEDFKGGISHGDLLRILDVYKATFSARYQNVKGLWQQVHITSIYHPKAIYHKMVQLSDQGTDTIDQLLRRITAIEYHYTVINKEGEKEYKSHLFPSDTLVGAMEQTIKNVERENTLSKADFVEVKIEDGEDLPF